MKRRDLLAAAAAASATVAAPWVHAQSSAWPTRGPIRLICQYPPGGLVDTVARLLAPHLSQALSQTVVVENRAGAGGLIGTEYAARQPADGYSLLVSHASVHVYATATRRTMPFDPVNDFTHMAMLVEAPMLLIVRGQSPHQTLAQYVNSAKTKPVRYGSSGIGSANHLFGELLKIEGQANEHDHVPYQGSAPALQDLMGGNVHCGFLATPTAMPQVKSGKLIALASFSAKRLPQLPDGDFQPPMEMNVVEKDLKAKVEGKFSERTVTIGRAAHLTKPTAEQTKIGRGTCQSRNLCMRGCAFGAYFSAIASTNRAPMNAAITIPPSSAQSLMSPASPMTASRALRLEASASSDMANAPLRSVSTTIKRNSIKPKRE